MRALVRWSDSSLRKTTPRPRQGVPSRRIGDPLVFEIAGVDHFEARLLHRQPRQAPAGPDDRGRRLGTHVALRQQTVAVRPGRLDRTHPRHLAQTVAEAHALRLDLDCEAAAEHLAAQLLDASQEDDLATLE